mmetsp:Transcript_88501/g.108357  ORF Transcript_88501/g.108357 Transcript_88501/m.108357 type:complete len:87 (-) Transcript_88501:74-334(-)
MGLVYGINIKNLVKRIKLLHKQKDSRNCIQKKHDQAKILDAPLSEIGIQEAKNLNDYLFKKFYDYVSRKKNEAKKIQKKIKMIYLI